MPDPRALGSARRSRPVLGRDPIAGAPRDPTARLCARPQCGAPAVASMSYDYAGRVVYVGLLAEHRHPALYDLCAVHADQLRVPQGWQARVEPWAVAGVAPR